MKIVELGFEAIKNGDYQEALNIFFRAIKSGENLKDSYKGLGITTLYLEDFELAKWAFYKALESGLTQIDFDKYMNWLNAKQSKSTFLKLNKENNVANIKFRVKNGYFYIHKNGTWKKIFIKGVNIGTGIPGYFPGEFQIRKATYKKWFKLISELNLNCIRVYTLMSPYFYEALHEHNLFSKNPLYLFQGIWYEPPEDNDLNNVRFLIHLKEDIRNLIDAVHGNAEILPSAGKASGKYRYDISSYIIGYIFGREPEYSMVKTFNVKNSNKVSDFDGNFIKGKNLNPFERWNAEILDYIAGYETEKYGDCKLLSVINWPTLDPLYHPSESNYDEQLKFFGFTDVLPNLSENEDDETFDTSKFIMKNGPGFFASYHVYPYYPDFMVNDYINKEDPYREYLRTLKLHYKNMPLLIAEIGLPTSRASAHWHPHGYTHGKLSENQQGELLIKLFQNIYETECAGLIIFSWFDEWFKKNWVFQNYYIPSDRKSLWYNINDPEENYGLLGMYPNYPSKKCTLSANLDEWKDAVTVYSGKNIKILKFMYDEGFIYLYIETVIPIDFEKYGILVGINTVSSDVGEVVLPYVDKKSPFSLQFLLDLNSINRSRVLIQKSYDKFLNHSQKLVIPKKSYQGEWVIVVNQISPRRVSKDKVKFYPSRFDILGNLKFGSLKKGNRYYDNLSDFYIKYNILEVRIPWDILNFSDPSSKRIIWFEGNEKSKQTNGMKFIVLIYDKESREIIEFLPASNEDNDSIVISYDGWDIPIYHSYLKESYFILKKFFEINKEKYI
ncbi:MAG: hypothetical protein QXX30_01885 [Candidatus Aenigmatarchaeota archaeon]